MSFRERLSKFWDNIQYTLFPSLENQFGELTNEHRKLVSILELVRIEDFIFSTKGNEGRPLKERKAIARAYIAKIVFKLTYTKQLVKYLKTDKQLRAICGFDVFKKIPSESTFSRAFKEFAEFSLPEKVHQVLIKGIYKDQIVGHIVIDSTPIETREKFLNKGDAKKRKKQLDKIRREKKRSKEPNRRQKQLIEPDLDKMIKELPNVCDKGMKISAQGYTMIWKGYKLHTAIDDHCACASCYCHICFFK